MLITFYKYFNKIYKKNYNTHFRNNEENTSK